MIKTFIEKNKTSNTEISKEMNIPLLAQTIVITPILTKISH